jgi:glycyl-tRNA synthetase alpha subunit
LQEELQYSVYNFELADVETLWQLFELHEKEAARLLAAYSKTTDKKRFPLLPAYDHVLKCSNLFNTLDSRGAISVTERVGVIGRVRKLAVGVAQAWTDADAEAAPIPEEPSRIAAGQNAGGSAGVTSFEDGARDRNVSGKRATAGSEVQR